MTLEEFKTWIDEQNAYVIFGRTTPTTEPLTPEQVQAFKQLYTFDNVTNVFCDGETTVRYYVNNDCGDTTGMLNEYVDEIKNDLGGLSFSVSGTTLSITDGTNTWTLSN